MNNLSSISFTVYFLSLFTMEISLPGYARNKGLTTNMVCTGDINQTVKERMVIFLNLCLNEQPYTTICINNFNNIYEHIFEVEKNYFLTQVLAIGKLTVQHLRNKN